MGSVYVDEGEGFVGGQSLKIAQLKNNGDANDLKAKPTHQNIIRLAPPLVITEEQIQRALKIIGSAMKELPSLKGGKEDEIIPSGEKNVTIGVEG